MRRRKVSLFLLILLLPIVSLPAWGERFSLKLSYDSPSLGEDDLTLWINSLNDLWKSWKNKNGGSLEGDFIPPGYGNTFEVELRFPIISGLALNLAGSHLAARHEGEIIYSNPSGSQTEKHVLSNRIRALPLKIGFSYSLPLAPKLSLAIQAGRQIIFVHYTSREEYRAIFISGEKEFTYWFKKENNYNSEGLGYYALVEAEFELAKFVALVGQAERAWSRIDGFKGPFNYQDYSQNEESGKASLYYYESNSWGLNHYYSLLSGHKKRPENSEIRNLRQGELNFTGYFFKAGIRIKF